MQLSYDSRGNSVPTILLLMQRRLYAQGGLQVHDEPNPSYFKLHTDNCKICLVQRLSCTLVEELLNLHGRQKVFSE